MDNTSLWTTCDSPLGELLLVSNGKALTHVMLKKHQGKVRPKFAGVRNDKWFQAIKRQLHDYFSGKRTDFDIPTELDGTEFQRRVWNCLRKIPYGKTLSYQALAKKVGKPNASRAVGNANGKNPLCIVIPCHRVIQANGRLGGYGGGLEAKQFLLTLEGGSAPSI